MKGKVCHWKDDKGFGFIQPNDGSEKLFFHVSSVKTGTRRPRVGDNVHYESIRDSQQRLKAKSVLIEGVSKSLSTSPYKHASRIEPPKKNITDYISIIVLITTLAAAGFEFYRSGMIDRSWPLCIPAVVAFIILNRQKKPKNKSFNCARCKNIAEYDSRTIQAWNKGITKLFCRDCHLQWLRDNQQQYSASMQNKGGGCLGVLALLVIVPVIGSLMLYRWL